MNTDEITARIGESRRYARNLRSPDAWSAHLNRAVKSGIRQVGIKHTVRDGLIDDFNVAIASITGNTAGQLINPTDIPLIVGKYFVSTGMLSALFNSRYTSGINNRDGWRVSMFYGPQLDRGALLAVAGRTTKLVKSLPTEK